MTRAREEHIAEQRAFYDSRQHAHLRPQGDDAYAAKLAAELARRTGIGAQHSVLEVGAGFGRFTFSLLDHCSSVVALDLSERALADLEQARDARGVSQTRCRTLCGDLGSPQVLEQAGTVDFVVGFFILHHLDDIGAALGSLVDVLRPGGRMAFLEPNRRNPLYAAQVMVCADMSWREEKGMFRLSSRLVERAYRAAGMSPMPVERFGFFPPQIFNRFAAARRIEDGLERSGWLDPLLPFLVLRATREPS